MSAARATSYEHYRLSAFIEKDPKTKNYLLEPTPGFDTLEAFEKEKAKDKGKSSVPRAGPSLSTRSQREPTIEGDPSIEGTLEGEATSIEAAPTPSQRDIFNYEQAKHKIHQIMGLRLNAQMRTQLKEKEPWEIMEYLQERFRPSGRAKIQELTFLLEITGIPYKKCQHAYNAVLKYTENIDAIIDERLQVDGSRFSEEALRMSFWTALKHSEVDKVRTIASQLSMSDKLFAMRTKTQPSPLSTEEIKEVVLRELR